MRAPG